MGADSIDSSSVGSGKKTTNSEQKWLTSFSENVVLQARIDIVCWKHVLRRVSFFFFLDQRALARLSVRSFVPEEPDFSLN